jgi:hypothetical protein
MRIFFSFVIGLLSAQLCFSQDNSGYKIQRSDSVELSNQILFLPTGQFITVDSLLYRQNKRYNTLGCFNINNGSVLHYTKVDTMTAIARECYKLIYNTDTSYFNLRKKYLENGNYGLRKEIQIYKTTYADSNLYTTFRFYFLANVNNDTTLLQTDGILTVNLKLNLVNVALIDPLHLDSITVFNSGVAAFFKKDSFFYLPAYPLNNMVNPEVTKFMMRFSDRGNRLKFENFSYPYYSPYFVKNKLGFNYVNSSIFIHKGIPYFNYSFLPEIINMETNQKISIDPLSFEMNDFNSYDENQRQILGFVMLDHYVKEDTICLISVDRIKKEIHYYEYLLEEDMLTQTFHYQFERKIYDKHYSLLIKKQREFHVLLEQGDRTTYYSYKLVK